MKNEGTGYPVVGEDPRGGNIQFPPARDPGRRFRRWVEHSVSARRAGGAGRRTRTRWASLLPPTTGDGLGFAGYFQERRTRSLGWMGRRLMPMGFLKRSGGSTRVYMCVGDTIGGDRSGRADGEWRRCVIWIL